jgi:4-amino-4-deoxy-L-arabinose transferase-like glycosyltransferase
VSSPPALRARRIRTGQGLAVLLALGAALRVDRLAETPAGLFADEAAIAANAWAIGADGRDLAGTRFPLYSRLRSFEVSGISGIVSQPVYQYASVPFVRLLGRTETAARLPAVGFGVLGIAAAYLLGTVLFGRRVGIAAAALLALAPWHLHLSRVGFEAVSLPALLALAVWQIVRGLGRPRSLATGAALLALATYAYPVARVFAPLLCVGLALAYGRQLLATRRALALAVALLCVLEIPNVVALAAGTDRARLRETLLPWADLSHERAVAWLEARSGEHPLAAGVLADRRALVPFVVAWNYAAYLSPRFLFLEGDPNPRHHPTKLGAVPLFYAPLLLVGVGALWRRRREPASRLLLWWLLTWPLPASMTVDAPHAIRSICALPALEIAAALGFTTLAAPQVRGRWRALSQSAAALLAVAALAESVAFLRWYHDGYRLRSAAAWQAGVGPALREVARRRHEHPHAIVSGGIFGIHAFVLFFGDLDPALLDPKTDPRRQLEERGYRIALPGEPVRTTARDLWLVSSEEARRAPWRELASFPLPDGSPNLYVVERPAGAGGDARRPEPGRVPRGRRESAANAASAATSPAARTPPPGGPP